ncbi:MAG: GntR family transcriptional regulator [Sphingorhabdus sp.]
MSNASDRAYAQIRGMILRGELSPGVRVSEEQMADHCGVSRTPVRDALTRLEAESFIRKSESQRSFVADWSLNDIEDAFILREMLEGYAARRAAERIDERQLQQLTELNSAIARSIHLMKPDITAFLEDNRVFHGIILEAAASSRLTATLSRLIEQPVVWRTAQNYDTENLLRSHREHDELLSAFTRRDGDWAEAVMRAHIRRAFHTYADAHRSQRAIDKGATPKQT